MGSLSSGGSSQQHIEHQDRGGQQVVGDVEGRRELLPFGFGVQVAQYVFTPSVADPTRLFLDGDAFGDELPAGRLLLLASRDQLPSAASLVLWK